MCVVNTLLADIVSYVSPCRKVCVVRLAGGGVEEQRTTPAIELSGDTLVRSHGWVVMETATEGSGETQ